MRGAGHGDRFDTMCLDARCGEPWSILSRSSSGHLYILGLEVLDNLPHDRIVKVGEDWMETWVRRDGQGKLTEELRPVTDAVIRSCIQSGNWLSEDMATALDAMRQS